MPLFQPQEGERRSKQYVVKRCLEYIHSPEFAGNVREKEQKISLISGKVGKMLEFRSRGKGWGGSALNPNCWVDIENENVDLTSVSKSLGNTSETKKAIVTDQQRGVTETLYNSRPWGGKYRGDVIRLWRRCAVTGCETQCLLTASHIKGVIYCRSIEEKIDPYNGILLSKIYDALFDRWLITFRDDGRIVVSKKVPLNDLVAVGVDLNARIKLDPRNLPYLRFHRSECFKIDETPHY